MQEGASMYEEHIECVVNIANCVLPAFQAGIECQKFEQYFFVFC